MSDCQTCSSDDPADTCAPSVCVCPDPAVCVPPPTTASPTSLVVIDNLGCYRGMAIPAGTQPILVYDTASGKLKFVTGADDWNLNDVTEIFGNVSPSGQFVGLFVKRSDDKIFMTKPVLTGALIGNGPHIPWIAYNGASSGWTQFLPLLLSLITSCGLLYKDCLTGQLGTISGTPAKYLSWDTNGSPVASIFPSVSANGYIGLYSYNTSASTLVVTCDEVALVDTAFVTMIVRNVNLTIDITIAGVNGLDTGAEAANAFYYIWIIYNGSTVAGLLSLSSSNPTMPVGYTYKRRVGVVNNVASNFHAYLQRDRSVSYYNAFGFSFGPTSTTTAPAIFTFWSAYVPPVAVQVRINARFYGITTGVGGSASFITANFYAEGGTLLQDAIEMGTYTASANHNMTDRANIMINLKAGAIPTCELIVPSGFGWSAVGVDPFLMEYILDR